VWLAIFTTILPMLARAFLPGPLENFPAVTNPLGIMALGDSLQAVFAGGLLMATVSMFLSALSLILRFHRAQGTARQQLKWLAYAATLLPVAYVLSTTLSDSTRLAQVALIISINSIPIAVGIAILRSNLYDIDIIIRRTLIYSSLTVTLAAVYIFSILLLQQFFQVYTGQNQPPLATVLSTLMIAALFTPLRRRIQNDIDRRFYRRKYDAEKMLKEFALQLRNEVDIERLSAALISAIQETVQPEGVSLWMAQESEETRA
jgi:hypothetical protein